MGGKKAEKCFLSNKIDPPRAEECSLTSGKSNGTFNNLPFFSFYQGLMNQV